jgi:hypothetical protein
MTERSNEMIKKSNDISQSNQEQLSKVRGEEKSEEIMGDQHSSSSSSSSEMTRKLVLAGTTGIRAALLAWNVSDFFQRSGNTLSLFAFNYFLLLSSFLLGGSQPEISVS